ncbi:MAG: hypothetical protein ACR2M1_08365 [Gemmatimonadaceae bacterium]
MTQHMTHYSTQRLTSARPGVDGSSSTYSALQPAPFETRQVREQISTKVNSWRNHQSGDGVLGGTPLSDEEIEDVLAGISDIEGLSVERFAAAEYAIDDEPDAIAKCPSVAELEEIAAAAERDDLTPEEMVAHSRLLWNAIAYFQRRARDYDATAKREAREMEMLRAIRDELRRQVDGMAA